MWLGSGTPRPMLAVTAEANETAATRAVDVNFIMMMLKSCDAEEGGC